MNIWGCTNIYCVDCRDVRVYDHTATECGACGKPLGELSQKIQHTIGVFSQVASHLKELVDADATHNVRAERITDELNYLDNSLSFKRMRGK